MNRIALLGLLAGLALGATACGERSEPTGSTVKLFPVTVGGVTLEQAPARVAAVGSPAISVVNALEGASPNVKLLALVNADNARLRAFKPDVVIASGSSPHSSAPLYAFSPTSVRDAESALVDVGALLGRPLPARTMIQRIQAQRRTVTQKVANLPRVPVFLDTGFFITPPSNSLAGNIVSEARGRSVAGANPGPGPYDLSLLKHKNPAFYLATSNSGITLKDLRKNPQTRTLRAVRGGHFGIVPAAYLQPGPDLGKGVVVIAKLLHPNAFR